MLTTKFSTLLLLKNGSSPQSNVQVLCISNKELSETQRSIEMTKCSLLKEKVHPKDIGTGSSLQVAQELP